MKIDLTIRFSKTFCKTYKFDGKPCTEKYMFPYVAHIVNNISGEEEYDIDRRGYESMVNAIFRIITHEENRLNIDQSFYKKYLVGWYCINKNIKEFLTPTKVEKIYEFMFDHMKNYDNHEGTLMLYFELV